MLLKIDEVAERILTLGYSPNHSSQIKPEFQKFQRAKRFTDGIESVANILESSKKLYRFSGNYFLNLQKQVLKGRMS